MRELLEFFGKSRWRSIALVAVAIIGGGLWTLKSNIIYVPRFIESIKDPISPPKEVVWDRAEPADRSVDSRPNIVLIMVDDLGFNGLSYVPKGQDKGLHVGGLVDTPNINSIAYEGLNFDQAYTASGTCAPSRAGLMTGRYPTRSGFEFTPGPAMAIGLLARENTEKGRTANARVYKHPGIEIPHHNELGLPISAPIFPERLKSVGYRTLMIGKWHLGAGEGMKPHERGFDEYIGFMPGQALYAMPNDKSVVRAKLKFDPFDKVFRAVGTFALRDEEEDRFRPGKYMTDYFSDEAVKVIDANKDRPFFLFLSYNAPHTPLQALKTDYDALDHIEDHRMRVYAAMIKAVDRGVGQVLDKLEAEGLSDNTIVIFTSDNGGSQNVSLPDLNAPLRGYKGSFFEGGVRVPFFMKWPQEIPAGTTDIRPVAQMDLFPTLANVTGFDLPENIPLDGRDLLDESTPRDELFWRNGDFRTYRKGDWKLHWMGQTDKVWLFNLATDPFERANVADTHPDKLSAMMAALRMLDEEQADPLWPRRIEIPLSLDHGKEHKLLEQDEYIYFSN